MVFLSAQGSMHSARDYLVGLSQLHELDGADERRASWRQGLASLAMAAANQRPLPLEGLPPDALLSSVKVALDTGLVDDVAWMSPGLAGAALFELAAALPPGPEKRDLGRRVLEALHAGDVETFTLLATSLAASSRRALATPTARARVAVALRLPIGIGTGVDRLALALLSRPELEREWLTAASTGPLGARRPAARLLERAAREAARRAQEGDDTGLRVLRRPSVRTAWARLLADRESLVWRHAATARGLLVGVEPVLRDEAERQLGTQLGPADWRRAVTTLAASIAHDPTTALNRCHDLIKGPLCGRDPGLTSAIVFGLSRAATAEPEAVESLLPLVIEAGDLDTIEALVDLLAEHPGRRFAGKAVTLALERLRAAPRTEDDGLQALRRALDAELSPLGEVRRPGPRLHMGAALLAFAEGRPADVRPHVEAALGAMGLALSVLERTGEETSADRQRAFQIVRELDRGLLESNAMADLLVMGGLDAASTAPGDLGDLHTRFRRWLAAREMAPGPEPAGHLVYRQRRMRAWLHAIDGEGMPSIDEPATAARERRLETLHALLERASRAPSPLRRMECTALARACDGLLRDELVEITDLLLAVAAHVIRTEDLAQVASTPLTADLKESFAALAELSRRLDAPAEGAQRPGWLAACGTLADTLPPGLSPRVESLRLALEGIAHALERLADAPSLEALTRGTSADGIERLDEAVHQLAELQTGVWRRLGRPAPVEPAGPGPLDTLAAAVARASRGEPMELAPLAASASREVAALVPAALGETIARVLARVPGLPVQAAAPAVARTADPDHLPQLPAWLPPSRILGGFHVVRPVGKGTVGSVFVVSRVEERHDRDAELFALKVPSYDGSVAHTLSEDEFLRLFREEAGALLTLPAHPNLAAFVTFDARARPKPILVMELITGPTIERVLARGDLSLPRALGILDGIAAGLEAMHAMGVGHLDLKPANVVLRAEPAVLRADASNGLAATGDTRGGGLDAVLVDFGLAGRKVRPGCASPYYGAPEVWDTQGLGPKAEPGPADVYSFCCLGYELLVGRPLFTGDTLPAVLAAHFAHDGNPPGLQALRATTALQPLADLLAAGLVPDPRERAPIARIRQGLMDLGPALREARWPLAS